MHVYVLHRCVACVCSCYTCWQPSSRLAHPLSNPHRVMHGSWHDTRCSSRMQWWQCFWWTHPWQMVGCDTQRMRQAPALPPTQTQTTCNWYDLDTQLERGCYGDQGHPNIPSPPDRRHQCCLWCSCLTMGHAAPDCIFLSLTYFPLFTQLTSPCWPLLLAILANFLEAASCRPPAAHVVPCGRYDQASP